MNVLKFAIDNAKSKNNSISCEIGDRKIMSYLARIKDVNVSFLSMCDFKLSKDTIVSGLSKTAKLLVINYTNTITGLENDIPSIISLCETKKINLYINGNVISDNVIKISRLIKSQKKIYIYFCFEDSVISNNPSVKNPKPLAIISDDNKYKKLFLTKVEEYMQIVEMGDAKAKYLESFVNTVCVYFKETLKPGYNNLLPISFLSSKNKISSYKISNEFIYNSDLSKPAYDSFSSSLDKYIKNGFFVLDFSKIKSAKSVSDAVSFLLLSICKQSPEIKGEILYYKKKIKPVSHSKNVRFSARMYVNTKLPKPVNSITSTGRVKSILKKKR